MEGLRFELKREAAYLLPILALCVAAGGLSVIGPDSRQQESMAPGFPSPCAYADGADGTESAFYQDLDDDDTADTGEVYPFTSGSRYEFKFFSGTGTAHCCVTDEHASSITVGDPDNVEDISLIDTSSTADEGYGHCWTFSDSDEPEVIMFDRRSSMNNDLVGLYPDLCVDEGTSTPVTATTTYGRNGSGPLYKACENSGDCAGITFESGVTAQCGDHVEWDSRTVNLRAGFIVQCNYTGTAELIACEKS